MHAARRLSTQNGLGNFLPLEIRKVPGSPLWGQNDGEENNLCFFCPWLSWGSETTAPQDRGPQGVRALCTWATCFHRGKLQSCLRSYSPASTEGLMPRLCQPRGPACEPHLQGAGGTWPTWGGLRPASTCSDSHSTLEAGSTPCWGCVPAWLLPSGWDRSVWLSSKAWAMTYVKD